MGKEKPVEGKFVTSVKVGPKGQIIVPKEVRDMFNIQPGDMLLMLADVEQGIAIQTFNTTNEMFENLFPGKKCFFAAKVKLVKLVLTFTASRAIMQIWCYK